jgi:hypothetical protein
MSPWAAMKAFVPWLAVLFVVLVLSTLHLRTLAAAVSVGWLIYCVYTWIRAARSRG